jgi:hypothetical protein
MDITIRKLSMGDKWINMGNVDYHNGYYQDEDYQ